MKTSLKIVLMVLLLFFTIQAAQAYRILGVVWGTANSLAIDVFHYGGLHARSSSEFFYRDGSITVCLNAVDQDGLNARFEFKIRVNGTLYHVRPSDTGFAENPAYSSNTLTIPISGNVTIRAEVIQTYGIFWAFKKEYSYGPFTIKHDGTAPTMSEIQIGPESTSKYTWYHDFTNAASLGMKVESFSEAGTAEQSGLANSTCIIDGTPYGYPANFWAFAGDTEGHHYGSVTVTDNVGNSNTKSYVKYIDRSPPTLPELSFKYSYDNDDNGYKDVNGFNMNWTPSIDQPFRMPIQPFFKNCGLKGYYFSEEEADSLLSYKEMSLDYAYYLWYIAGDVTLDIVATGSKPAVLYGLFVDPANQPLSKIRQNDAFYLGADEFTRGDWTGKYGQDGYLLPGYIEYESPGVYITLHSDYYTSEPDISVIANPAYSMLEDLSGEGVISSAISNPTHLTLRINITDGEPRRLALFWPRNIVSPSLCESQRIEIRNGSLYDPPYSLKHSIPNNDDDITFGPAKVQEPLDLEPEKYYALGLIPSDNLFQRPKYDHWNRWETKIVATAPETFNIVDVDYGIPYVESGTGYPVYPVNIRFDKTRDVLNHMTEIRVLYNETGSEEETELYSLDTAGITRELYSGSGSWSEYTADPDDPDETGEDGQLVLHTVLKADTGDNSLHAHKPYHFTPAYRQIHTDDENLPIFTKGTGIDAGVDVPNLVDYRVHINTLGESHDFQAVNTRFPGINNAGIDFDSFEIFIRENEKVYFSLEEWVDAEGDYLSLDLYTINDTPLTGEATEQAEYSNPYRQKMHCYLYIHEKISPGGNDVADTETWDYRTEIGTRGEGFYLSFDAPVDPWEFFLAKEPDPAYTYPAEYLFTYGGKDYRLTDTAYPTFSEVIKLGASGRESENLYFRNLAYRDFQNRFRDLEYIALEDLRQNIDFSGASSVSYNSGLQLFDWELNDDNTESGKERIVAARFGDGNDAFYTYRMTLLNTDIPDPPWNADVDLLENDPALLSDNTGLVSWSGSGGTNFLLRYTVSGITSEVSGFTETSYSINLSGMGHNERVDYEIRTVGRTGQLSEPVTGYFHTPAYPGTYNNDRTAGYEVSGQTADLYLSWSLENSVVKDFIILLDEEEVNGVSINNSGTTAIFKVYCPDGKGSYSFEIVPVNEDGHKSINRIPVAGTFPNFPPEQCGLLTPGEFVISNTIIFSWNRAVDGNNDTLSYSPEVRKNGGSYIALGVVSEPGEAGNYSFIYNENDISLPEELRTGYFEAGAVYHWRVGIDDGHGPVYSEPSGFVVDPGQPDIAAVDKPIGFSSRSTISVNITPSLSGITGETVHYSAHPETGEEVLYSGEVPRGERKDGKYNVVIPLEDHSQPYTLQVSVTTGAAATVTKDFDSLYIDNSDPALNIVSVNLPGDAEYYYGKENTFPVSLELSDNFSGFSRLLYGFSGGEGVPPEVLHELSLETGPQTALVLDAGIPYPGSEGEGVFLYIRVEDNAGRLSPFDTPGMKIYYDAAPPVNGFFNIEGFAMYNGGFYLRELDDLTDVTLNGEDPYSGIEKYQYALEDESSPAWYDTWDEVKASAPVLTDGKEYRILGKMTDRAGNPGNEVRVSFVADNSPPGNITCSFDTGAVYLSGETISFRVTGSDQDTPVSAYRVVIGAGEGDAALSEWISPASGGVLESGDGLFRFVLPEYAPGQYTLTIEAFNAAGVSGQLLLPNGLNLSNEEEVVIVRDEGPFHTDPTRLSGSWDYKGAEIPEGYQYRIIGPGYEDEPWQPVSGPVMETNHVFSGLSLIQGEKYSIEVTAYYKDDILPPIPGSSPGVIIDTTPPVFNGTGGFTAPGACHSENLKISWDAGDPVSGIGSVELVLEKLVLIDGPGGKEHGKEAIGSVPVRLATNTPGSAVIRSDGDGNALGLRDGDELVLTLRIINGAGLVSEKGFPAITWDNSPPGAAVIVDQGLTISEAQVESLGLTFNWIWSGNDPESGIEEFLWKPVNVSSSAGLVPEDILSDPLYLSGPGWYSLGKAKDLVWDGTTYPGLSLPVDGQRCFILVKTVNRAGLERISCSNGIDADAEGPLVSEVKLLRGPDPGLPDTLYINRNDGLFLHIEAVEDVSAIALYETTYGVLDGNGELIPAGYYSDEFSPAILLGGSAPEWPVFKEGDIVYFEGKCKNSLDQDSIPLESGLTKGVLYETLLPVLTYVDGRFTGGEFIVDWDYDAGATGAPVDHYSMELWLMQDSGSGYEKERKIDLAGYNTDFYLPRSLTVAINDYNSQPGLLEDQRLHDGAYALFVKAVSAADNISVEKSCEIVIVDTTPPELDVLVTTCDRNGRYIYDGFEVTLTASDLPAPMGIAGYEYAAGSLSEPFLYSGGWVELPGSNPELIADIDLGNLAVDFDLIPGGTALYFRFRVKDRAGQWSNAVIRGPLLVDKTPALVEGLTVGNSYNDSLQILRHGEFSIVDEESGVSGYRSAVVPDISAPALSEALADNGRWKTVDTSSPAVSGMVGSGFSYTTPVNYPVNNGETAYMVVQAKNETGQWSPAYYSPLVTFDTAAPVLSFSEGDNGVLRSIPGGEEFVYNSGPLSLKLNPGDEISPEVKSRLTLLDDKGDTVATGEYDYGIHTPGEDWLYEYAGVSTGDYSDYRLHVTVWDLAGNSLEVIEPLRINDPPDIRFVGNFETTPGKPLTLAADTLDPDNGERRYTYGWEWNNPGVVRMLGGFESSTASPEIRLLHETGDTAQESAYGLSLTVTDADGGVSTETIDVKVFNTGNGTLYYHETWSGTHEVTGDIIVPDSADYLPGDVLLTVAPGALVEVRPNDPGYRITVQGTMVLGTGSRFALKDALTPPWDGIRCEGTVSLEGATIEQAYRGLTIMPSSVVTFSGNNLFENNKTGIHVLKNGQAIAGVKLLNNQFYGIKEENITAGIFDCIFNGNRIHYHTWDDTRLTVDQLNSRTGSNGNTEQ